MIEKRMLQINDSAIVYHIKRSRRRRRHVAIGVTHEGVTVVTPPRISYVSIEQAVLRHASWIIKKLAQFAGQVNYGPPAMLTEDATIYYLGELYTIKQLSISDFTQRGIMHWYRQQAQHILIKRADHYQSTYGIYYQQLSIGNQKSQWGNCDKRGKIRLNWRLVMLPLALIDYVVVHELCHIVHLNHSRAFWQLVEKILPDYREQKKLLHNSGSVFHW